MSEMLSPYVADRLSTLMGMSRDITVEKEGIRVTGTLRRIGTWYTVANAACSMSFVPAQVISFVYENQIVLRKDEHVIVIQEMNAHVLNSLQGQTVQLLVGGTLWNGTLERGHDCYAVGVKTFYVDDVVSIKPLKCKFDVFVDEHGRRSQSPILLTQIRVKCLF